MPKFVPRQRKHKVRRREAGGQSGGSGSGGGQAEPSEANIGEIVPASRSERDEKRRQLREELRAQQPKSLWQEAEALGQVHCMNCSSSPARGPTDRGQDTKLKKEENLNLIKRLAQAKVDTSLLKSSRTLGAAKESKRDVLSRALRERAAGINVEENEDALLERRVSLEGESESNEDRSSSEPESVQAPKLPAAPVKVSVGSGLKRPLQIGDDGNPIIATRKRKRVVPPVVVIKPKSMEWEGFDSDEDSLEPREAEQHQGDDPDIDSDDSVSSIESDAEDDSSDTSSEDADQKETNRQRSSAFKAWATQQVNESLGFQPSADTLPLQDYAKSLKPTTRNDDEPLPRELQTSDARRDAFAVHLERTPKVMQARLALPVVAEEQKIMEAIHNNPVVVIWGATGSGKTTQLPQFLYEAGYGASDGPTPGMIGITQPRRVAAVSMAKRVGEELGKDSGRVGYKIRFEGTVSANTAIKFMTDGILLREAARDITLSRYSVIIIDEAHERTKDTDILIGMMSRIVKLREDLSKEDSAVKPLKLVIMSATLRISDFTENSALFPDAPPLVQAEGRQHAVTVHWSRRTTHDYPDETFRKVSKAHRRLPPGGILVFLTGQNEITHLSSRLKKAFAAGAGFEGRAGPSVMLSGSDAPLEAEDVDLGAHDMENLSSDDDSLDLEGDDEFDVGEETVSEAPIHVLPLYSLLPTREQLRVFEPPPEGTRLVVLATNVAETSLTIPGIRYVFDCGRAKERRYDDEAGVQSFEIGWISKASASQRAGRAGRTGPGHCYRLYSSAVYERDFQEYAVPEILRTPIEGVVLQLSALNVPNIVDKFPFPTPPDRKRLVKAQQVLWSPDMSVLC